MSAILKIPAVNEEHFLLDEREELKHDVLIGLGKKPKHLSSKYFYNQQGSELFNQITRHPDYYLTGCELEILNSYKKQWSLLLKNDAFNIIELGPGEGIKSRVLVQQFLKDMRDITYYPIDISKKYLNNIVDRFNQNIAALETVALNLDYLSGLKWLAAHSSKRNLVLFLGSSIGNFDFDASIDFLTAVRKQLNPGDYMLIGFDLLKAPDILTRAYNDRDGITREFNLNLLQRINDELGGHFDLNSFHHHGSYNVHSQAMESYLISSKKQRVFIEAVNKFVDFDAFEAIHTESSQKYSIGLINKIACLSEFKPIKSFSDARGYFLNCLWQV